jgi:trk system potassium uptake protein TrkH
VLRHGFFTTISIITTAGLSSCDFLQWGTWMVVLVFLLSFVGGCTGSTCGSIKILRWQVIYAFLKKYLLTAIEPNRVIPLKIGASNMSEKITMSVFVYIFSFLISLALMTAIISLCGYDFATSLSAVAACITNVGLGSTEVIGPNGNFAFFSDTAKYIFCFVMLLGRLEVITLLVLLTKSFWRG